MNHLSLAKIHDLAVHLSKIVAKTYYLCLLRFAFRLQPVYYYSYSCCHAMISDHHLIYRR